MLIRERKGFQIRPEYGTEPSVYYLDGKIGASYPPEDTALVQEEPVLVGAEV